MTPYVYVGLKTKPVIKRDRKGEILLIVANYVGVPASSITGRLRLQKIAYARHLYCLMARVYARESLTEIGRFLGRNHTTVIHSITTIRNLQDTEIQVSDDVKNVSELVEKIL